MAELVVDHHDDDTWTWRYVEPGVELHSNAAYPSREAAADAAGRAYPDLEVTSR